MKQNVHLSGNNLNVNHVQCGVHLMKYLTSTNVLFLSSGFSFLKTKFVKRCSVASAYLDSLALNRCSSHCETAGPMISAKLQMLHFEINIFFGGS
jgi:hypothetical protein